MNRLNQPPSPAPVAVIAALRCLAPVALLVVVMVLLAACVPLSGKNPVPGPVPDHGPEATLEVCVEPYINLRVAVLDINAGYASRDVLMAIASVEEDGHPALVLEDRKTGERSQFVWSKPGTTSPYRSFSICVEYPANTVAYFQAAVTLVDGRGGDSIGIEVERPDGELFPIVESLGNVDFRKLPDDQDGTITATVFVRVF